MAVLVAAALPAACASQKSLTTGSGGAGGDVTTSSTSTSTSTSQSSATGSTSSGMGACQGPADCAGMNDACNMGTCVSGVCQKMPANENGACDDGKLCTSSDVCQSGVCVGSMPTTCKPVDDCHVAVCDATVDKCVQMAGNDGSACDDKDPCTSGTTCTNGTCGGGGPTDCSQLNTACATGSCDPVKGCVPTAMNEGGACDDGLFCTIQDVCTNGVCGGIANDCGAPSTCLVPQCDEVAKTCGTMPANNGTACNDNDACTTNDLCNAGTCSGASVGCINNDGCCPAGCNLMNDSDCNVLGNPSYNAAFTFTDALQTHPMGLTFDGTNYWSVSGGGSGGVREAKYNSAGTLIGSFSPGIDFRAITSLNGSGSTVFSRAISSTAIKTQTADGVFGATFATLSGGTLDAQANVVQAANGEFVSMVGGTVSRWTQTGAFIQSFSLVGFTAAENTYPQNRGIVVAGGYYLTYNAGTLSAWNGSGVRVATTVLNGAGTTFDSYFSFSYANNMVFVCDNFMSTWRGYNVGL